MADLTVSAAVDTLMTSADQAALRTNLGLGTLATQSGTFSGTSSGTNTGDQTISITGDVTASGSTGALASTVVKINGTSMAGLVTGILKNTTGTGVPSIAVAGDFPTLNQNTSGTAANLSGTPALPNGTTATTQTAGSADTKIATDAYADTAALATHLGTFASPNTAAGAITWTSPVYNIYTSAGSTRTYTLPAASTYVNRAFILNVAVGTGHVNVQPASGAALVLAGVLLTADHYVQATTSAPGNYICFISDGTNWTSLGSSGTWVDSASA